MSNSPESSPVSTDTVRDVFLWRRKKLSLLVLVVSTLVWVVLDVYQFNLVTVASWAAMFAVTSLFAYGHLVRLFRKEEPNLSALAISEDAAIQAAHSVRRSMEEGTRWMFHVSAEREWFIFARGVAVLWFLSYVGSLCDFLTLLYAGIIGGLTLPLIYKKNEDNIKRSKEWMKMKARRVYDIMDEKVIKKTKSKLVKDEKKDEKVE